MATAMQPIPGYAYGDPALPRSPVTLAELESLKKVLLFTDDDLHALRMSADVLRDQTDAILDVWYGFVAATPELVYFFGNRQTGAPEGAYLAAVRKRFAQWILDTAQANYDQAWLDYQHEIGLRHNRAKKNQTDHAASVEQVNYRYIPALTVPLTTTLRPFLAQGGHAPDDVERMYQAWLKSVLLQAILWAQPYVRDGQF